MADRLPVQQVRGCRVLLQQTKLTIASDNLQSSSFHTGVSRLNEVENTSQKNNIAQSEPKNFVQALYSKVFTGLPKAKLKACGYMLETHCSQVEITNKCLVTRLLSLKYHIMHDLPCSTGN